MTYIVRPLDKAQDKAVKAVLDASKVPYEKTKEESPYNPEFVKQILQSVQDVKMVKALGLMWKIYGSNLITKSR